MATDFRNKGGRRGRPTGKQVNTMQGHSVARGRLTTLPTNMTGPVNPIFHKADAYHALLHAAGFQRASPDGNSIMTRLLDAGFIDALDKMRSIASHSGVTSGTFGGYAHVSSFQQLYPTIYSRTISNTVSERYKNKTGKTLSDDQKKRLLNASKRVKSYPYSIKLLKKNLAQYMKDEGLYFTYNNKRITGSSLSTTNMIGLTRTNDSNINISVFFERYYGIRNATLAYLGYPDGNRLYYPFDLVAHANKSAHEYEYAAVYSSIIKMELSGYPINVPTVKSLINWMENQKQKTAQLKDPKKILASPIVKFLSLYAWLNSSDMEPGDKTVNGTWSEDSLHKAEYAKAENVDAVINTVVDVVKKYMNKN